MTDDTWALLAGRARTLSECLGAPGAESDPSAVETWCQAFSNGDEAAFARRLGWDGLTLDDAARAAAAAPAAELPAWTGVLGSALARAGEVLAALEAGEALPELSSFAGAPPPFFEVWIPFVREGRARAGASAALGAAARGRLEAELLAELSSLGAFVLFELFDGLRLSRPAASNGAAPRALYEAFTRGLLAGGLEQLFEEYAVLGRLSARLVSTSAETIRDLEERLAEDREVLKASFGAFGGVVSIRTGLSDRHTGGRRVLALRFGSGACVVYKPRTMALEAAWNGFLEWVARAGVPDAPPALAVLDRGAWGWSAWTEQATLAGEAEADAYFRTAGGLLAAAWLFGGRDLHMDNVVASAAGPVVVDAEAMLQPTATPPPRGAPSGAFDAANERLETSFVATGLLTLVQTGPDGRLFDVGGLSGTGGHTATLEGRAFEKPNTDAMRIVPRRPPAGPMPNLPVLGAVRLRAEDRPAAVLAGFASLYRFLLERRDRLFAADGPFARLAGIPVRLVFRPSDQYARLLGALESPRYLRDGFARSVAMDVLNRPFAASPARPALWPLVADEREALEALDIPCFRLPSDADAPVSVSGVRVDGPFAASGLDALKARAAKMGEGDLAEQMQILRALVTTGATSRTPAAVAEDPLDAPSHGPASAFLDEASHLADTILAAAVAGEDGALTWMDPSALRGADRPDRGAAYYLYDGAAGTVLFLSAAAAATGRARYREAARAAALPLARVLDAPRLNDLLKSEGLGGCHGTGSLVYALAAAGRLLGEAWPLALATRAARLVTPERIESDGVLDVEGGSAGAILGLLALHETTGESEARAAAEACGDHLLDRRVAVGPGLWGWPSADGLFLAGLAHGASGFALALGGLAAVTGRDVFRDAAVRSLRYERTLFDARHRNWPVLARDGDVVRRLNMTAWCHGAPGVAAARLGLRTLGAEFVEDLGPALDATCRAGFLALDHVCCGNAGLALVLLDAGEVLGRPDLAAAASARAGATLRRARAEGAYRLRETAAANAGVLPGFFRGLAGVGWLLLAAARPGSLPPVARFALGESRIPVA
jgi:type 2 lantibiotic biosynthesis protein LanM